jgi:hypothetical protein
MLVAGVALAAETVMPTAALSAAIINRFLIMTFPSGCNVPRTGTLAADAAPDLWQAEKCDGEIIQNVF